MLVVLTLALFSLLCPPSAGYLYAFLTMLWLIGPVGFWRGRAPWFALPGAGRAFVWTLFLGTLAFTLAPLLAAVLAAKVGPYQIPLKAALEPFKHLATKRAVQYLVLGTGVLCAYGRGLRLRNFALPLAIYLGVYFVYAVIQRATGIDWVHGWEAKLPPNREAYGTFRVSGFMGHPISLSYNLMLVILTIYAQLRIHGDGLTPLQKKSWYAALVFSLLNLLLSGSRWPLVVVTVAIALEEGRRLFKHAKWVGLAALGVGVALAVEGTLASRIGELFGQGGTIYDKVPRLLFWKIHWQMFTDNPWFGVGFAPSMTAATDYYVRAGFAGFKELYPAHNIFLQSLADGGLLGFAGLWRYSSRSSSRCAA